MTTAMSIGTHNLSAVPMVILALIIMGVGHLPHPAAQEEPIERS